MTIKKIEACDTWSLRQEAMWPDKEIDYVKMIKEIDRETHRAL